MVPELTTLDHFVLTVDDLDRTLAFYERVVGAEPEVFDGDKVAMRVGDRKVNLHAAGGDYELTAGEPTTGAGDFCVITTTPMAALVDHLEAEDVDVVAGPGRRVGARGEMTSVYFRDPDDNLVEVATYDR